MPRFTPPLTEISTEELLAGKLQHGPYSTDKTSQAVTERTAGLNPQNEEELAAARKALAQQTSDRGRKYGLIVDDELVEKRRANMNPATPEGVFDWDERSTEQAMHNLLNDVLGY